MISSRQRTDRPRQDDNNRLRKVDVGGRYMTEYDPAKALEILERIAEGETLSAICKGKEGMPHPKTFKRWVVNNPELAKAYQAAVVLSAGSLEEEALDSARAIALQPKDGTHVRAVEVKLNQLRWSMERRDPSKFGQRNQINVRVPVQIITPIDLNLGSSGNNIADIYTIEATQYKEFSDDPVKSQQLVTERPVSPRGTPGRKFKKVLTPPGGPQPYVPFSKLVKGIVDDEKSIRASRSDGGDREEHSGARDEGLHLPCAEEGDACQQEGGGPEQAPEVDREVE